MGEYMPKVGDRVRATLGENVLVGTVRDTDQDFTEVAVSDGRSCTTVWHNDGWRFVQVMEVPNKKYALVGKKPYEAFTSYWLNSSFRWLNDSGEVVDAETVRRALAERDYHIMFEGVDG